MESLGVHEHWNNSVDKQYSRNLGTDNGIELISSDPMILICDGQEATIVGTEGHNIIRGTAGPDIIHGFKVFDTNINIMVIPGQISEVTHTFDEPGEFQFYCHEYCGSAHHTMTGVITITEGE